MDSVVSYREGLLKMELYSSYCWLYTVCNEQILIKLIIASSET